MMPSRYSLPPVKYGGTERVVWGLGTNQEKDGHEVRYLWGNAPNLPANASIADKSVPLEKQINGWPDIVHFHRPYDGELHVPYISTEHGNADEARTYSRNCVFLSNKHAQNHGAECFVHNGLNWDEYGEPNIKEIGDYFVFLGKTKAPTKNLQGTVQIAQRTKTKLSVLGGTRLNIRKNPYFVSDRRVKFHGMVGGDVKNTLIKNARALLFPVRWHEPFGLAIIEALYLGVPVIGTKYGSLPEIISEPEIGFLSNDLDILVQAAGDCGRFNRMRCHEVAKERFSSYKMHKGYEICYQKVLDGEYLNSKKPCTQGGYLELLSINGQ